MSVERNTTVQADDPELSPVEIELDLGTEIDVSGKGKAEETEIIHATETEEPEKGQPETQKEEVEAPVTTKKVEDDDDDLEIPEVVDEKTRKAFGRKAKKRIHKLVTERDEYNLRAQELEARLAAVEAEKVDLIRKNDQSIYNAWHQAENRIKNELALAQRDLKSSKSEGDADAEAEAQGRVIKAQVDLENTSRNRAAAEARVKAQNVTPPEQVRQVQQPAQQRVAQQQPKGPSERALAWKEKNTSWFGKDQAMTGAALGIHNELMEEGVTPDTEEYYAELDSRVRSSFPAKFTAPKQATTQQVVAAPSRAAVTNAGKTKVVLTPNQQRVAKRLGLSYEQYAREVYKMNGAN